MSKYMHVFELKDIANNIKEVAANSLWGQQDVIKVHKRADEAIGHLDQATSNMRDLDAEPDARKRASKVAAISGHLAAAAGHITDTHRIVSGIMGQDTPADVLQVAHLGEAHTLHDNIMQELNEGLKNGS